MKDIKLITFPALKNLENRTIQAIRTDGPFGHLSSLRDAACSAQIARAPKASINVHLGFTLPTRLREDKGKSAIERPIHVGCLATCSPSGDEITQLSYSILIGEDAYPTTRVARKFHFDFEPSSRRNLAEPKPTYHLQMCGELSGHHVSAGYTEDDIRHLLPAWSQPRVPAQPMSLALVLNWLLLEFGCEAPVQKARLSPHWRSLVREAEQNVLKPYFDECSAFLAAKANEHESFYSKQIYQER